MRNIQDCYRVWLVSISLPLLLTAAFIPSGRAASVTPDTIYVYDMSQTTSARSTLMASLAGVVARTTADVALGFGNTFWDSDPEYWVDQFIANHPDTSKVRQSGAEWFIDRYQDQLSGYVVYDSVTINEATSVAGALGALMVEQSLLGGPIGTALADAGLGQVEDVRGRNSTWVYNQYGSMLSKEVIFRQQPSFSYQLRSLAVKEGGFVFNETGSTRDTFLAAQNDHSLVYGWGFNNDENEFFSSASRNNLMGVPADHLQSAGPHSRWDAAVPVQPAHTPVSTPTQAGKHYVAFVMSDGDNIQWLTNGFARNPRWFGSPYRGDFDFTFDLSPALLKTNPVALQTIYDQASADANKTFFVTPGGEGLNYPSQVPDLAGFMDATTTAMVNVDQNIISVLDTTVDLGALQQMAARDEVMGLMLKTGPAYAGQNGAIYWSDGKPIVSVKYTLWDGFDTPNDIIGALNNGPTDPFNDQGSFTIVNVHPWSTSAAGGGLGDPMSNVQYITQNLNNSVEVVTLEELMIHLRNNFGSPVDPVRGRNLVFNGDFEMLDPGNPSRPEGWFYSAGTALLTGEDSDGNGQYAVAIDQVNSDWRSIDFDSEVGEQLTFAFDFQFDGSVPDGSGFRADARFFNGPEESGGQFVGETTAFVDAADFTDNQWQTLTLQVTVPEGSAVGDVRFSTFFHPFAAGQVMIDNIRLLREPVVGDFNADGVVDGADLSVWQAAFGISDGADADGDGDSDGADFLAWQRNVGVGEGLEPLSLAVPEPTAAASLMICLFGWLGGCRSRIGSQGPFA